MTSTVQVEPLEMEKTMSKTNRERAEDLLRFVRSGTWCEEDCIQRLADALGAAEVRGREDPMRKALDSFIERNRDALEAQKRKP